MISLNTLVAFLLFYAFYVLLEVFQRKLKIAGEYTRKIAHVITGLGTIFAYQFLTQKEFIFVTSIFLLIFIISYKRKIFNSIHQVERKTYGEITYPLGIMLIALVTYDIKILFIYGVLLLAIPDVSAYLAGRMISKNIKKTYWGSFAYFITALIILITGFDPINAILIAAMLSLTEFISPYGLDNLTVPLIYTLSILL
jgi:phytol kinase